MATNTESVGAAPSRLSEYLQNATEKLKSMTLTSTGLVNTQEELDERLEPLLKGLRAGRWLLGNPTEEKRYLLSLEEAKQAATDDADLNADKTRRARGNDADSTKRADKAEQDVANSTAAAVPCVLCAHDGGETYDASKTHNRRQTHDDEDTTICSRCGNSWHTTCWAGTEPDVCHDCEHCVDKLEQNVANSTAAAVPCVLCAHDGGETYDASKTRNGRQTHDDEDTIICTQCGNSWHTACWVEPGSDICHDCTHCVDKPEQNVTNVPHFSCGWCARDGDSTRDGEDTITCTCCGDMFHVTCMARPASGVCISCKYGEFKPSIQKSSEVTQPIDEEEDLGEDCNSTTSNNTTELGEDDEITIGDYRSSHPRSLQIPHGTISLEDGTYYHVAHYFGSDWIQLIKDLYGVRAMEPPRKLLMKPWDYQLKGAAQIHHACEGPLKGLILGDEMGTGKTLQAVLAAYRVRNEPGMSLVVAPVSAIQNWLDTCSLSWKEGAGLHAHWLKDQRTTATQLMSMGYDIIICSYEFLESSYRGLQRAKLKFDQFRKTSATTQNSLPPKRPTSALFSDIYRMINRPWKRVFLDEAQVVSKRGARRHDAIKSLFAKAIVSLTGTPMHNKWHAISGYIDYLQGHPFTTHESFLHAFAYQEDGRVDDPNPIQIRTLQRFLQAAMIARPSTVNPMLQLIDVTRIRTFFHPHEADKTTMQYWTTKYRDATQKHKDEHGAELDLFEGTGRTKTAKACFKYASKALMAALHPLLCINMHLHCNGSIAPAEEEQEERAIFLGQDIVRKEETAGTDERQAWLNIVGAHQMLMQDSRRLHAVFHYYDHFRKNSATSKIVIFSVSLKWLDIIAEAFRRRQIDVVRFDGTVSAADRTVALQTFRAANTEVPLLVTAGAGGTALNIGFASIVFQTEPWWNRNVEAQALGRVLRPDQQEGVMYFRLEAECGIEPEMVAAQERKTRVNRMLMKPLIRRHDEDPEILPLLMSVPLGPVFRSTHD